MIDLAAEKEYEMAQDYIRELELRKDWDEMVQHIDRTYGREIYDAVKTIQEVVRLCHSYGWDDTDANEIVEIFQ